MDPEKIERELAKEKNWKYKGEIKASARPVDSLLKAEVDFDTRIMNIPITKDENALVLKYITQRFREKTFDNYEFADTRPKIVEETYDVELIESHKEIFELYEKIEESIRSMMESKL